jgi:hypothetical protein
MNLLSPEQLHQLTMGKSDADKRMIMIDCLMVATEIAWEVWALKMQTVANKFVDIDCIYRK